MGKAIFGLLCAISLSFPIQRVFYLMGTYVVVDLPTEEDAYRAYRFMKSIEEKISDFIPTSEVSKINRNAGIRAVEVSEPVLEVIKRSLEVSEKTYGYFDITVGSLTINHKRKGLISEAEALDLINFRDLVIKGHSVFLRKKNMAIDLGGIGKGFVVEKTYRWLGTKKGFIGAAGDMKVWGQEKILAIRNPISGGSLVQMINSEDLCLSTSGNYLREHIKQKDKRLVQITVVHKDCTLADAYSTALFSMPKELRRKFLRENPDIGVLELYYNGDVYVNSRFREFFKLILFKKGE